MRLKKVLSFSLILSLTLLIGCMNQEEKVFYVSTDGSDSNDGSKGKPFQSISKALESARAEKNAQQKTIVLKGGSYFETNIVITPADSGLTIKAAEGETPVLYGGRKVSGWEKDGDFYSAKVEGVAEKKWDFRSLIVNDNMRPRARLPKEGSLTHLSKFDVRWMSTTGGGWERKPTEEELTTMIYKKGDLGPWLDVNNAELTLYHSWDESMVGLSGIDDKTQTVKFSNPAGYPPGSFGAYVKKAHDYVVWNVREGMTDPGQWYLDRTNGKIVYWPLPEDNMETAVVIAPVGENVIKIEKGSHDITLDGLTISSTTTPLVSGGFGAYRFDGAITGDSLKACVFNNLKIKNIGGWGMVVKGDSLIINRCDFANAGAGGLRFNGKDIRLTQSYIHDVGVIHTSAIALGGGGENNLISHNEFHDTPYSAISYGGDYSTIESNLFYNTMTVLNDGAAIYFGGCKGVVVRGNVVKGRKGVGSAYYMDEKADSCIVEKNLALDSVWPSHNHMALNCIIRNNVFIDSGEQELTFPRCFNMTLANNIFIAKEISIKTPTGEKTPEAMKKGVPESVWPFFDATGVTSMSNNIMYSTSGKINLDMLMEYNTVKKVQLEPRDGNVFADPMFNDTANGDYGFKVDSPALKLGIEPIDVSDAGVTIEKK